MADFTYKGKTISITPTGAFEFIGKGGKHISKPSLKAAQNAVDKEIGQVLVYAMTSDGKKIAVAGRHRSGGYVNDQGNRVGNYGTIYPWSDEASQRLAEIRAQDDEENKRHEAARAVTRDARHGVYEALGNFAYEEMLAKEIAMQAEA